MSLDQAGERQILGRDLGQRRRSAPGSARRPAGASAARPRGHEAPEARVHADPAGRGADPVAAGRHDAAPERDERVREPASRATHRPAARDDAQPAIGEAPPPAAPDGVPEAVVLRQVDGRPAPGVQIGVGRARRDCSRARADAAGPPGSRRSSGRGGAGDAVAWPAKRVDVDDARHGRVAARCRLELAGEPVRRHPRCRRRCWPATSVAGSAPGQSDQRRRRRPLPARVPRSRSRPARSRPRAPRASARRATAAVSSAHRSATTTTRRSSTATAGCASARRSDARHRADQRPLVVGGHDDGHARNRLHRSPRVHTSARNASSQYCPAPRSAALHRHRPGHRVYLVAVEHVVPGMAAPVESQQRAAGRGARRRSATGSARSSARSK